MPRDSNGNTNPLPGTIVQTGDTILPSQHNPALVDLYAMMAQSLSRDGQGGMRANLAMNGFQITGLGNATQPGNAVPLSQFQSGTPVGAVVDFAGVNPPDTWLLCFGQAVSRTTYPDLFAAIGTTYGSGDGSTTFNLPDLRGRVVAGKDNMGGASADRLSSIIQSWILGSVGGNQRHTLTIGEMPSHNHGGKVSQSGLHSHQYQSGGPGTGSGGSGALTGAPSFVNTSDSGLHDHIITPQGGGAAHNNVQPTIIMNKIIKVSY